MNLLIVNSKANCYELAENSWEELESKASFIELEPGTYVIRIQSGIYSFWNSGDEMAPFVLLWIHGGRFKNLDTGVETKATLKSLNSYHDTMVIEVKIATNLYAFFLDSYSAENRGEVSLSVLKA